MAGAERHLLSSVRSLALLSSGAALRSRVVPVVALTLVAAAVVLAFTVTGDGSAFDPGIALPFTSVKLIILLHIIKTHDQGPIFAVRSQSQVDAENMAIYRNLRQAFYQGSAKTNKEIIIADGILGMICLAAFWIGKYEVHIG